MRALREAQEVMLRRLKREVMGQLPPKCRQVVRLPPPEARLWLKDFRRPSEGGSSSSDMVCLIAEAAKEQPGK